MLCFHHNMLQSTNQYLYCKLTTVIIPIMLQKKPGLLNVTQGSYKVYVGSPAGSHLSKLVPTPDTHGVYILKNISTGLGLFWEDFLRKIRVRPGPTRPPTSIVNSDFWRLFTLQSPITDDVSGPQSTRPRLKGMTPKHQPICCCNDYTSLCCLLGRTSCRTLEKMASEEDTQWLPDLLHEIQLEQFYVKLRDNLQVTRYGGYTLSVSILI